MPDDGAKLYGQRAAWASSPDRPSAGGAGHPGPGLIAANSGNDAGGILTYASAGAQFGYRTLFLMVLVTVALIVVQEMCSRLGVYTGEGLGGLIREQFSPRATFAAMTLLLVANAGLTVSEFAGSAQPWRSSASPASSLCRSPPSSSGP